jgi:hypothetical protein
LPACNRHIFVALGAAAVLALASLLWGAADALLGLKVAAAVVLALGLGAAAVFHFTVQIESRTGRLWRLALEVLALGLCALFVLSRGAPHNNPALYALYADYGVRGLGLAATVLAGLAVAGGLVLYRQRVHPMVADWRGRMSEPEFLRCAGATLALLAMLAALEPVIRFWDVPGWGDSNFYDHIAHEIALGQMPVGHSYYMPVYQYGTALLYYLFGHFFFVQQLANVLLAPVTVVLLCLSAWNMFRNPWAVLLVGALAAGDDVLRHAPYMQQIENWYVPALSLAVFTATRYFRAASLRNLVWLALAAGLVFNLRTQGAFFVGFLLLAPFFLRGVTMRERLRHFALAGAMFVVTLVPWTVRNYAVDGRLSPVGTQGAAHILYSNDPRIFYGIRRDLAPAEAVKSDDEKAVSTTQAAIARVLGNPMLLVRATPWRTLAFYGLLPPGVWDKAGPRPTDWAREGKEYLLRVFPVLCLLGASIIGLLLNPGRATLFLTGAILGNLAVVMFVGFSEPRLSFPVQALHILLAGATVFVPRLEFAPARVGAPMRSPRHLSGAIAAVVLAAFAAHLALGRPYLLRGLTAAPASYDSSVAIDANLPDLAEIVPPKVSGEDGRPLPLHKGERVRATVALTNHHLPVKYYAFPLPGFPDFAADPKTDTYYLTYLLDASGTYVWGESRPVAIGFAGAVFGWPLREEDVVEVEGEVLDMGEGGVIWLRADKVRWLHGGSIGSGAARRTGTRGR